MWMQSVNEWWGEFMVQIGSLFVPITPAILLGFGVYTTLPGDMPMGFRLAAAIAAPIGATAVEFTSGKMFVKSWIEGNKREMWVAAIVAVVSVSVIGTGVLFLEAGSFQKILNIGLYVVSLATYLAQALNQIGRNRDREKEREGSVEVRMMELEVEKAKADAAAARAKAREAKAASSEAHPGNLPQLAEQSGNLPKRWPELTADQRSQLAGKSASEIADIYPHLSERTTRLWSERARLSVNGNH